MAERNDDLCDVAGILVGHDTDLEAGTGCTVVRCAWPALGAVDVRGGAPGTRETDLLDPRCMMTEVHAVLLTGGSAFGLAAADGVMRALADEGVGYDAGVARVPIVPAAVLFDLGVGRADVRPDAESGMRAVRAAAGGPVALGTVGAGTGATVGKMAGPTLAVKGGVGSASYQMPDGHVDWRAGRGQRAGRHLRCHDRAAIGGRAQPVGDRLAGGRHRRRAEWDAAIHARAAAHSRRADDVGRHRDRCALHESRAGQTRPDGA